MGLPVATVSDVQRHAAGQRVLDPSIHSLVPGVKLVGPAFTVWTGPGSIITVHKALLEAPAGVVLVVGGEAGQDVRCALFGKLMALQARRQGIAGLLVDGAVRDIADLRELRFPVFARGTVPTVGLNRSIGQTQVPVPCGGVIVYPGDWIVGDDDGVIVIPADEVEPVVTATEERLRKEAAFMTAIERGQHIADLVGFTALIRAEEETRAQNPTDLRPEGL